MAKMFVLKLANYCECDGCKKTMKNLREIDGVDSASIDPKTGKLTVSGPVNPQKVIRFLKEKGKKATLIITEENRPKRNNRGNAPIITLPAARMRQRVVVQESEVIYWKKVEKVEVTFKETIFHYRSEDQRAVIMSHQRLRCPDSRQVWVTKKV